MEEKYKYIIRILLLDKFRPDLLQNKTSPKLFTREQAKILDSISAEINKEFNLAEDFRFRDTVEHKYEKWLGE